MATGALGQGAYIVYMQNITIYTTKNSLKLINYIHNFNYIPVLLKAH